jgi:phosphoribosylformylglycinamidine synthase
MPRYVAEVRILLKPSVNDPQGQSIKGGLHQLGFEQVQSVRAGKLIELQIESGSEAQATEAVRQMCDKLLANPVIERYEITLSETAGEPATS